MYSNPPLQQVFGGERGMLAGAGREGVYGTRAPGVCRHPHLLRD